MAVSLAPGTFQIEYQDVRHAPQGRDVKTRWNSMHAMFARFIKLEPFLIEMLAKEEWNKKVKTKLREAD